MYKLEIYEVNGKFELTEHDAVGLHRKVLSTFDQSKDAWRAFETEIDNRRISQAKLVP